MKIAIVALLALSACSDKSEPSCAERVKALAARLADPRPLDEIRKGASPELAADLEGAAGAAAYAERLQKAVANCPPAIEVFTSVGAVEGSKSELLRTKIPPSFEACGCKASPEHAGSLVEAILGEWERATNSP